MSHTLDLEKADPKAEADPEKAEPWMVRIDRHSFVVFQDPDQQAKLHATVVDSMRAQLDKECKMIVQDPFCDLVKPACDAGVDSVLAGAKHASAAKVEPGYVALDGDLHYDALLATVVDGIEASLARQCKKIVSDPDCEPAAPAK
jgi:hypothetical protein